MTADNRPDWRTETILARAAHAPDTNTGALVPAIQPATTYARDADYELRQGYIYGRYGSPTSTQVEQLLCCLDEGESALAFSSGMSAVAALAETLTPGRHMVLPRVMYHGAQEWLLRLSRHRGIEISFYEAGDLGSLEGALRTGVTELAWVESPANPTWRLTDIAAAAERAHAVGALLVVDSTAAPPVTTRPLRLGADVVLHSASKYLNGHSDVLAGALVRGPGHASRWEEIRAARKFTGTILEPFAGWLLLRGLRTLAVRYARQSASALELARHLEGHPDVSAVLYPGLVTHPDHELAQQQMCGGYGGMLSILVDGDAAYARRVAAAMELFSPATSLGGVESLVEHRASVEGPGSVVAENLLRFSVGLEAPEDLIADVNQALARAR